jgi:hypothetical protein
MTYETFPLNRGGGTMSQDRKYFGMTIRQLAILVGLGVFACLLFSVMGVFTLRRGLNGFLSRAPQTAPTVRLTATPFAIPTVTPTETSTPIPYDQLIPAGWIQHKTALIELWLPSNFKAAGSGAVSGVAGNSVVLELALVSSSKSSAYKTTASISYEPLTSDTLDNFLNAKLSNIPAEINMTEHRTVSINSVEAYRVMFESHNNNVETNDLLFVFQDGSVVWYVKYSAEITDFYEMLPVFEQSIKTFRIGG